MPKTPPTIKMPPRLSKGEKERLKEQIAARVKNTIGGMTRIDLFAAFPVFNNYAKLWNSIIDALIRENRIRMYFPQGNKRMTRYVAVSNEPSNQSYFGYEAVCKLVEQAETANPNYNFKPLKEMLEYLRLELHEPRFNFVRTKTELLLDFTKCEEGGYVTNPFGVEKLHKCPECGDQGVVRVLGQNQTVMVHAAVWKAHGWETLRYCPIETAVLRRLPIPQEKNG